MGVLDVACEISIENGNRHGRVEGEQETRERVEEAA